MQKMNSAGSSEHALKEEKKGEGTKRQALTVSFFMSGVLIWNYQVKGKNRNGQAYE